MANEEKCIIRSLISPKIKLDILSDQDYAKGSSTQGNPDVKSYQNDTAELGVKYPLLTVNGYKPGVPELIRCDINYEEFLPRINVEIQPANSARFKSFDIPKDGDLVSVFIRAKNNAFKPIRNDFVITSVISVGGMNEGVGGTFIINGVLSVPRINDETIKSFTGTSFEVLQLICKELGLGFATNETETADSQNWICTGDSYLNFIDYICSHAWKNEKSFYMCYIDAYYHLNFINVNNQLDGDGKVEAAIVDQASFSASGGGDFAANTEESAQRVFPKMLSDMESFSGTNMYVSEFAPINNSSRIAAEYGYKSFAQFFDQATEKMWDIFVDPITSEGAETTKVILKGRVKRADGTSEDFWKTQNKKFWLGIQYKDVHDKYLYSKLWNERNNAELEKMFLETTIVSWNPNIYRGEKIPLIMHSLSDGSNVAGNARGPEEEKRPNEGGAVTNNFYSGYYMVMGFSIRYSLLNDPGPSQSINPKAQEIANTPTISQVFQLTRREWPIPLGPAGQSTVGT
jgi:hypothetical protein